jgi:hypothetical protein
MARTSKIDPNWDFWLENKPSGNPGSNRPNGENSPNLVALQFFHGCEGLKVFKKEGRAGKDTRVRGSANLFRRQIPVT